MERVVTAACIAHEGWQILLSQMLDMVLFKGTYAHTHAHKPVAAGGQNYW
jgi:hypothetical protein